MNEGPGNIYRLIAYFERDDSWEDVARETADLERDIARLAKESRETIYFRDYKDPSLVAHNRIHILLECSDKFLEEVKKLSAFGSATPFPADDRFNIQTVRRDEPQTPPKKAHHWRF